MKKIIISLFAFSFLSYFSAALPFFITDDEYVKQVKSDFEYYDEFNTEYSNGTVKKGTLTSWQKMNYYLLQDAKSAKYFTCRYADASSIPDYINPTYVDGKQYRISGYSNIKDKNGNAVYVIIYWVQIKDDDSCLEFIIWPKSVPAREELAQWQQDRLTDFETARQYWNNFMTRQIYSKNPGILLAEEMKLFEPIPPLQ